MTPYYDDGSCTIYHGDCRDITDWLAADVLVTDPPYGYDHSSGWEGPFRNQAIQGDDSTQVRDQALVAWGDRPAVVFGSCRRAAPANVAMTLVWDKGLAAGMGDLSIPWKPNWEHVYIIGKGFKGRRDSGVLRGYNVVTWASKGRGHPNAKPVDLLRDLIQKCPPGVIADPFIGSGSTLRAAKDLGRKAIGVEVEERYCELAASRLCQEVLALG